jgi:hypothetical protein
VTCYMLLLVWVLFLLRPSFLLPLLFVVAVVVKLLLTRRCYYRLSLPRFFSFSAQRRAYPPPHTTPRAEPMDNLQRMAEPMDNLR